MIVDLAERDPHSGQVVAALLGDGTMVAKRFDTQGGRRRLIDNQGRIYPIDEAEVQGTVVSIVRRFR